MAKKVLIVLALFSAVLASAALLAVALRYAAEARAGIRCQEVRVDIARQGGTVYLQERDVLAWLGEHGLRIDGKPMAGLSPSHVESVLRQNPFVQEAQVYATEDGVVHLDVWQRNPVLKVLNRKQELFQIDAQGVEMPDNPGYRSRLRVASGHIPFSPEFGSDVSALPDTAARAMLKVLFRINAYLDSDPLWNALFEQIYVTSSGEIELIPKVGGQIVELGKVEGMEDLSDKMFRLKLFYQKGMSQEGWEKYSVLNLKYRNQLVATCRRGF